MVYCGKASQGCQNCRTRRIKCDKVRPECSQCLRVHKKCPGYRDQLSLMFRDESTKVIQKAHASWGFDPGDASSSADSPPVSPSELTDKSRTESPDFYTSPLGSSFVAAAKLPRTIDPTKVEQGIQFYLEHYILGHPDEPRTGQELRQINWLDSPGMSEAMAAVGLAGLSNLYGNEELQRLSRQNYGLALQHTARAVQNLEPMSAEHVTRAVVMLAMFEVVRGNHEPSQGARTHIIGAASMIRSFAPWPQTAMSGAMRGLLQLCCSLVSSVQCSLLQASPEPEVLIPRQFIPCQVNGLPLPNTFFDWLKLGVELVPPVDRPAADLLQVITQFVQLSALLRSKLILDGRDKTAGLIQEVLDIERRLADWERGLEGIWLFTEVRAENFPPDTVFHDKFHAYTDMWTARVWNHYRWCRILANQTILEFSAGFPQSSRDLITKAQCSASLDTILRISEETLVSLPTHWRHPRMDPIHRKLVDRTTEGTGIGAAGLPSTLFHIKVAGSGPGIPYDFHRYALAVLDTVWADMGMLQAKALADLLRAEYNGKRHSRTTIIKQEPSEAIIV